MKHNPKTIVTAITGLVFSAALVVGCSSKPTTVSESSSTTEQKVVTEAPSQTTVAQNTNLGAGSSGFAR